MALREHYSARALRRVMDAYLEDADFVIRRARLVAASPALRDCELRWIDEYQRRLGGFIAKDAPDFDGVIWSYMAGSALLTVFRHVLAAWATGDLPEDPELVFDRLAADIAASVGTGRAASAAHFGVAVVATSLAPAEIARLIHAAERSSQPASNE